MEEHQEPAQYCVNTNISDTLEILPLHDGGVSPGDFTAQKANSPPDHHSLQYGQQKNVPTNRPLSHHPDDTSQDFSNRGLSCLQGHLRPTRYLDQGQ